MNAKMSIKEARDLDSRYLFQNYGRQEVCFERGEKEFLYDLEGNRWTDLVAGIAVMSLGYAHPDVVAAVQEQASRMMHVSNLYLVKEQALAAQALASVSPAPLDTALFVNSGAEANEAALKLASKRTGRGRFVSSLNSFHGRTAGSLAATGQRKYQDGFAPLLSDKFDFIKYNDVEALKAAVGKSTAALILEPVQGEGGVRPATEEFFRAARDVCDDSGALLICDEVQTGMGRTGRWFGFQHFNVVPDIVTLAKALGSGAPIGACLTSHDLASTFTPGSHGTTFGGNPLACSAALATLEVMKRDRVPERADEMGRKWSGELRRIASSTGRITDVRGHGLIIGLEMGEDAKRLQAAAWERRYLVNVCAGSVLRLIPPLIVSEESLRGFNSLLESFISG